MQDVSKPATKAECAKCGVTKPAVDFHKTRSRPNGLSPSCKDCRSIYNKERIRTGYYTKYYAAMRRRVLAAYGGACSCCGEDRYEFLAIDHIDGRGNEHRREVGSGSKFLRWLRDNQYPEGFRILCHNCNMAAGFFGYCPHNATRHEATARAMEKLRTEPAAVVIGKPQNCAVCGIEFLRAPSAKAKTCSYKCMGVLQSTNRITQGERNGNAKVTDDQRSEIRRRRALGERQLDLAEEFGLSCSQILRICKLQSA